MGVLAPKKAPAGMLEGHPDLWAKSTAGMLEGNPDFKNTCLTLFLYMFHIIFVLFVFCPIFLLRALALLRASRHGDSPIGCRAIYKVVPGGLQGDPEPESWLAFQQWE